MPARELEFQRLTQTPVHRARKRRPHRVGAGKRLAAPCRHTRWCRAALDCSSRHSLPDCQLRRARRRLPEKLGHREKRTGGGKIAAHYRRLGIVIGGDKKIVHQRLTFGRADGLSAVARVVPLSAA